MRQMNVSIGIITHDNSYILQKRGADPKIGAAGKIGAFGGKIEPNETPADAVCRELAEETSLRPRPNEAVHMASYTVLADHQLEPVEVNIEAFEIAITDADDVTAAEGEVVRILDKDIPKALDLMTPATRYYFETVKGE